MQTKIRRVVTGHDDQGRAKVLIDEVAQNAISRRPGHASCVIWTTDTTPVSNDGDVDAAKAQVGRVMPGGSVFRIMELSPGVAPARHRTESIDYLVVMAGECDMELDGGVEVHLQAGDVMVQRGTIHNWINRGTEPCVVAVVLIHAAPVQAGGKTLGGVN